MKRYKGYLLDLDGTMYRGNDVIKEAREFVKRLFEKEIPYLFVTNNSSKTPKQVMKVLNDFGIQANEEQVITSSMAAAGYIATKSPNASVYFIGEDGLEQALMQNNLRISEDNPDYVIVGIDRGITYEKLAIASLAVRNGATYLLTNGDVVIPTHRGLLPGNGSLASVITVSTAKNPIIIGKPEPIIMEQAMTKLGLEKNDVLMVGDNYQTDIMAGIRSNIDTLLVETGVTMRSMLTNADEAPTYCVKSLEEWFDKI